MSTPAHLKFIVSGPKQARLLGKMTPNLTLLFPLLTGWKLHGEVIPAGFSLVEEGGVGKRYRVVPALT